MVRMPPWLKQTIPPIGEIPDTEAILKGLNLHTICQSGRCPNTFKCFPEGTAFLLLGNSCTRNCSFCAVDHDVPQPPDPDEPARLVEASRRFGLDYVFLTSVTRDDLADGGAGHFAATLEMFHREIPESKVEVLVPDFAGDFEALKTVVEADPTVLGHNVETVPRLYPYVRPMADYRRSLELLAQVKILDPQMVTKSGIMLGLGEEREEVFAVMRDLRESGCDLITLGQYLAPSRHSYPVACYVTPQEFEGYLCAGREMGFRGIASAPLMRSSFQAGELYRRAFENRPTQG